MADSAVFIAFTYSSEPLVQAALGGFRVYPVDDGQTRLAEAIEVAPDQIPTASAPLTVPMPPGASAVEVVPVDAHGYEGARAYMTVAVGLPPVLTVSQIIFVNTQTTGGERR